MVVNQGFRVVRGIVQQAQGNSFIRWNKNSSGLCINNSTVAVVQWLHCVQLCDPMDCSMPVFPVLHCLPGFAQIHVQSQWCYLMISSSVTPFSSCPQSFQESRSFPMSWVFTSHSQSIRASTSILPMNIQGWFPFGLTGLISCSPRASRVLSSTVQKHKFFGTQCSLWSNSHIHNWLLEKPQLWPYRPLSAKWCLCFLIRCLGLS